MSRPDRAYVRNAADPQQVEIARRLEQDRDAAITSSLKAIMGTPEGRRVLAEFLETAGVNRTVYDHSGSAMYFNEGRRCLGLEWKGYAEDAAPDLFLLMEQEMRELRAKIFRTVTASRSRPAHSSEAQHGS